MKEEVNINMVKQKWDQPCKTSTKQFTN